MASAVCYSTVYKLNNFVTKVQWKNKAYRVQTFSTDYNNVLFMIYAYLSALYRRTS